jgi:thiol:disulfide interchange protein/DsbC/DsbD-like thiol-disulfide interchange protein
MILFMIRFIFLAVLAALLPNPTLAATASVEKHVAIRLIADKTDVAGGDAITVGIEQTIAPGWHVYWVNPGDSGIATTVAWAGMDDITAGDLLWPVPEKLPFGPLTNYGYEKNVTLIQSLTLPGRIPAGAFDLTASIDLLVCKEVCIPESHTASLAFNGSVAGDAVAVATAQSFLPIEAGWETLLTEKDGDAVLTVTLGNPTPLIRAQEIEWFPEEWGILDNTAKALVQTEGNVLTLRQKRGDRTLADVPVSKAVLAYQDAQGQRRAVRLSILTEAGGNGTNNHTGLDRVTFLQAALFALLGGLILNLMPCVFPVLSMKALSLVKLKGKELSHARLYGLAYTAGILLSFALIAGGLIALKNAGAEIGWGFQLQSPAVILVLSYLLFLIGLNLAGVFEFTGRLSNIGAWLTHKHGYTGSFFTGVLATLVATPCTAPFMGVAMGYALTQSAPAAMTIFLSMGLGLALPYLALCFVPALRHALPKPGAWMDVFKQFLAFPMFASAAWLVWVLAQQTDAMGVFTALLGMIALAFIVWLGRHWPERKTLKMLSWVLAASAIAFVLFTLITPAAKPALSGASTSAQDQNWEAFSEQRLDDLLADGYPVFVNMTAAWCITCKVNDNVALNVEGTRALFAARGIKYLKGDWTNQNPDITKFLSGYGRSGVPLYVYYAPRDEETGKRPEPVVLPQILTPQIVADTIKS